MNRLLCLVFVVFAGCGQKLPNTIAPEEYEVYSAWLKQRFDKKPDSILYLGSETLIQRDECNKTLKQVGAASMMHQLVELGDAIYPLHLHSRSMHVLWPFQEVETLQCTRPPYGAFQYVQFSRVAFNRRHDEALLRFNVSFGETLGEARGTHFGGGGGSLLTARRQRQAWVFSETGCTSLQ